MAEEQKGTPRGGVKANKAPARQSRQSLTRTLYDQLASVGTMLTTDAVIDMLITAHRENNPGFDVYDRRYKTIGDVCGVDYDQFQYCPRCMYFFYMRVNMDGAIEVDHYFYVKGQPDDPNTWQKIEYDELDDIMYKLAINARPSGNNIGKMDIRSFDKVKFRRRSYVAFFLDEANWAFHKYSNKENAVIFNEVRAGNPNYCFFDARDVALMMPTQGGDHDLRTGLVMINHMKADAYGHNLSSNDKPSFFFDMFFDVKFADRSNRKMVVIFDPGGENQGPPETP